MNVVAELKFKPPGKGDFRVVAGTIAAGDVVAGRLSIGIAPPWGSVSGKLHYSDLAGGSYVSPFEFSNGPGGLELELGEQQHVTPVDAKAAERGR